MTFRVPQGDDDFHSYGDSSQDENRSSQGFSFYTLCLFLVLFFYLPFAVGKIIEQVIDSVTCFQTPTLF